MKSNLRSEFNSRQYMISSDYEIYYYSDTHMPQVKDHMHDYYEFYFFLEGDVSIDIAATITSLQPGDLVLIPPGIPHHAIIHSSDTPYRRFVLWISNKLVSTLLEESKDYGFLLQLARCNKRYIFPFDILDFNMIQSKIFQLIEELQSNRFGKKLKTILCIKDLLFFLNRRVYEIENPELTQSEQTLYQGILAYIEDHISEELTLDLLSEQFYISKYHIAHVFKRNLGISVHQYILKKRLQLSQAAILSHPSISEAFLLCGFKDYSAFFRAFKKEFGISPKEYREQYTSLQK